MNRPPGDRRHRRRGALVLAAVVAALLAGCGDDEDAGPSREEIRTFLDTTFQRAPGESNTWRSEQPVTETADSIDRAILPRDRVSTSSEDLSAEERRTAEEAGTVPGGELVDGAVFMRADEWAVAVLPAEPSGSRIEYDDYDRVYNRYGSSLFLFWGASPFGYGPRGVPGTGAGGGIRGGGPGAGK